MLNKKEQIQKITMLAQQDKKRRQDPRYLKIMGFLVAKGFLYTNARIPLNPNAFIRILEVLPAAYERFKNHFAGDADTIANFEQVITRIRQKDSQSSEFYGIPIEKIRPWFFIRLKDRRSKSIDKRKVSKTFRLKPEALEILKNLKEQTGQSESEILEKLIAAAK